MSTFLRSLSNIIITAVTIIGFISLFRIFDAISMGIILGLAFFISFIALVIYKMTKTEDKISSIEEKFKRVDELTDIRSDINALKLMILKKWIKKEK